MLSLALVVLKDQISVLGPVLGLEGQVLGPGLGLESLVLALRVKSLLTLHTGPFWGFQNRVPFVNRFFRSGEVKTGFRVWTLEVT